MGEGRSHQTRKEKELVQVRGVARTDQSASVMAKVSWGEV